MTGAVETVPALFTHSSQKVPNMVKIAGGRGGILFTDQGIDRISLRGGSSCPMVWQNARRPDIFGDSPQVSKASRREVCAPLPPRTASALARQTKNPRLQTVYHTDTPPPLFSIKAPGLWPGVLTVFWEL